jgi:membrane protease YdiL (CAAX protease family)
MHRSAVVSAECRFWLARGGELVAAAMLVVLLQETHPDSMSSLHAFALGCAAGFALAPLALVVRPAARVRPSSLAAAIAVYLVARAAVEEVVWRLAVTGRVAAAAGWPAGLALGSLGFALAHAGRRPALPLHLLTGLAFGGLYLGTGRLLAAVAAHAAYNLLLLGVTFRRT